MKRICLLIATGALIVAGCGGSSSKGSGTDSTPASGSGGGHVNITLWHGYTDVEGQRSRHWSRSSTPPTQTSP